MVKTLRVMHYILSKDLLADMVEKFLCHSDYC